MARRRYGRRLPRSTGLRSATDLGHHPTVSYQRPVSLRVSRSAIAPAVGVHFPFSGLTVDHILPRSRGGTDHLDNLQLLCLGCNSSKGNRTMPEWRAAQRRGGGTWRSGGAR